LTDTFVSTGAFKERRLDNVFETARRLGIRHIELSSGLAYSSEILSEVLSVRKEFHFLVHNYFPPAEKPFLLNLASGNDSIRQSSLAFCRQALNFSAQIGSPLYSVHCGFTFDGDGSQLGQPSQLTLPRVSMDEAMANFISSLSILLPLAEELDIILAIENNAAAEFAVIDGKNLLGLGADADNLNFIFEQFDSDHLFLLLDLGHAKVNSSTLGQSIDAMINLFQDRIVALHISDNDGRNDLNWPLYPDSDLWPYINKMDSALRVIESYHADENILMDQIRLLSDDFCPNSY